MTCIREEVKNKAALLATANSIASHAKLVAQFLLQSHQQLYFSHNKPKDCYIKYFRYE